MSRHPHGPGRGERGSATVEFAIALPAVLALIGVALALGGVASAKVQCVSAAHAAARQAMVEPDAGTIAATAQRVAGDGAQVSSSLGGDWVSVTVTKRVRAGWLNLTVTGSAHARSEPTWPGGSP